jgi:hypothetical protein
MIEVERDIAVGFCDDHVAMKNKITRLDRHLAAIPDDDCLPGDVLDPCNSNFFYADSSRISRYICNVAGSGLRNNERFAQEGKHRLQHSGSNFCCISR